MPIPCTKKALSFSEQVKQLKSRGLLIESDSDCETILSHINYYRLSAYMYPFLIDKENHKFKEGTTFNQVLSLYNFDNELRVLLFEAIGQIEISIKTHILYYMAHRYGPFWIGESSLFYDFSKYSSHRAKLEEELGRSDEIFLKHFYNKYSDIIPPVWMTIEIASFGLISQMFENIKEIKVQKNIAQKYSLPLPVFTSWLHTLTYARNICAHHSRIWNRELGITPVLPKAEVKNWLDNPAVSNKRIFIVISIIIYFLSKINSSHEFKDKFTSLLKKYPEIDLASMGFPQHWVKEPFFIV